MPKASLSGSICCLVLGRSFHCGGCKWLDDFIDGESYTESFRAGAAYSLTAILLAAASNFPLTFALFAPATSSVCLTA